MVDPVDFADLTTRDAARARDRGAVLVLPVGAVEAHGPHLPLATDTLLGLDTHLREEFEERAAIIEYDAKLSRAHAECLALIDVLCRHPEVLPRTGDADFQPSYMK